MSLAANRLKAIKPSPTLAVSAKAARLAAEGRDVISMGAGEPDFDTPQFIKDAAIAAINRGATKYTAAGGTPSLKKAICAKFKRENGLDYSAKQILVSCGGKQSSFNLCLALLDAGDEAIIPAPYWVSYPDMAMLCDGLPVTPDAGPRTGYKISAKQLAAAITPKTRLAIFNSPCNPTGAAYTRTELQAFGEVLSAHPRVLIATDDIYEHIYWGDEPFCSLLTACPQLYNRTITINGASKVYAMTGWRIGYCGGPAEIITAMGTVQGQSTSNASSISQKAVVAALNGDQSCVAVMNTEFKKRHDLVVAGLNSIPGISCLKGAGTFYAFANVEGAMKAIGCRDDNEFAEYLLNTAGVAVVPGSGFGAPGHMRLSFATSTALLESALERIAKALSTQRLAVGGR
ncbi:MAG: pyridoxal phosphate-dependent aminotransferase [Steroidobacterales bacterium]